MYESARKTKYCGISAPGPGSDYYCDYGVWKQAAAPAGQFLAAFVSGPTHPAGKQMFAPGLGKVGMRVSPADLGSFKNDL